MIGKAGEFCACSITADGLAPTAAETKMNKFDQSSLEAQS
jgi:hypothetical protein